MKLTLGLRAGPLAQALMTSEAHPQGIALTVHTPPVEELFGRTLRDEAYDVAEMSLSSFVSARTRFTGLPVFPLRRSVHGCVYVSTLSGIRGPGDLAGRRVAAPDFAMTAAVWMRGILADEHGVPGDAIEHWVGGLEAGRVAPPSHSTVQVHALGAQQTLAAQLADGAIDALISPAPPSTLASRPGDVARLFDPEAEQDWFQRTGIHPPMHVFVVRSALLQEHPSLASSLYRLLAGPGDGLAVNREALRRFLRYHHEQGLTPAGLAVDEIFAETTRST